MVEVSLLKFIKSHWPHLADSVSQQSEGQPDRLQQNPMALKCENHLKGSGYMEWTPNSRIKPMTLNCDLESV